MLVTPRGQRIPDDSPVPVPVAPVVVNDTATTKRNTAVIIRPLLNDTDFDPATVEVVTAPANGTAVPDSAGAITYTPANNFTGDDSFSYRVKSPAPDLLWSVPAKVDAWAYRTTITNIAGNVISLNDQIPSPAAYLQPAAGAWAGSTVFAQREFALPAGLPERLEDHPLAKLVWRATDID